MALFSLVSLRSKELQPPVNLRKSCLLTTLGNALLIGILLTTVLILGSAVQFRLGVEGLALVSFASGFLDGHAAAFAVSEMVTLKKVTAATAVVPILLGLTSNTVAKAVFAIGAGGWSYARRVIAGLAVSIALTWVPLIF